MSDLSGWLRSELCTARDAVDAAVNDSAFMQALEAGGRVLAGALEGGRKVLAVGNGGSAADASHFCEELTGKYRFNRPALPAIACTDPGHLTCVANDFGYDHVFARFVEALGQRGDVLVALSTSGNSANVLRAIETAKARGLVTIGLTGPTRGELAEACDHALVVPKPAGVDDFYSDRIQEVHMLALHVWVGSIERLVFGEAGSARDA